MCDDEFWGPALVGHCGRTSYQRQLVIFTMEESEFANNLFPLEDDTYIPVEYPIYISSERLENEEIPCLAMMMNCKS